MCVLSGSQGSCCVVVSVCVWFEWYNVVTAFEISSVRVTSIFVFCNFREERRIMDFGCLKYNERWRKRNVFFCCLGGVCVCVSIACVVGSTLIEGPIRPHTTRHKIEMIKTIGLSEAG